MEKTTMEAKIDMSDSSSTDVFEAGKHQVGSTTVGTRHTTQPPTELLIVFPLTKGTFPVLLFCHGFMLSNTWYTTIFNHIASHGYIVVAPKFYGLICISIPEEVKRAAKVTEWISSGLPLVLPQNVERDMENLALSGHSRGGKTAFALALGRTDGKSRKKKMRDNTPPTPPYKFKALIGIDPVAGTAPSCRPPPKILEYVPRCFNMSIPVAVIGSGLGNQSVGMLPAFAPNGVNHSEFFNESKPPACYFLTKEYGHVDFMDDNWAVNMIKIICKSGKGPMDVMRASVGGIVVAFLRCYLEGDDKDINVIVTDPAIAPITLDPVIYVKE